MPEIIGVAIVVLVIVIAVIWWVVSETVQAIHRGVKTIYRLLPSVAKSEREQQRLWQEEMRKRRQEEERQEQERQRQEEARRKVIEDAKRQFEKAVMGGRFPSEDVLAILADDDSDMPVDLKEAVEELVYGRCALHSMAFSAAVPLIRQRQRIDERARNRREKGFGEPSGSVTPTEAHELLGVSPGCSPEELSAAYHRTVGQWHPDKLENMAEDLKAYATRQTQRINEAFQLLRQQA